MRGNFTSNDRAIKKVWVAMSGGVDSSVSAALLKEKGYEVTGVFIKAWSPPGMPCTAAEDRRDAMRVAAALGIPFKTLDLEAAYKRDVVDCMIEEYKKGRTPNPDIMCNRKIKFGAFYAIARARGADAIATGHYARRADAKDGATALMQSADREKDQTYFLWAVPEEALRHTLFPIGGYEKRAVRELARKFDLPTAEKKDSQGLCFIGKIDMKAFLKEYIDVVPGEVVDERGTVIGRHNGALFYTIGQRHGFSVAVSGSDAHPRYVVGKDMERNRLIVSEYPERASGLSVRSISLSHTNWLGGAPRSGGRYTARFRYRQPLLPVVLVSYSDRSATVRFNTPQHIAAGQSLVLYEGKRCLGGGIAE